MFITQSVTLTKNKLVLDGERGTVVSDVKAVKGSARFVFYVSETGQVSEVWLANPLGFGLDKRSANAVRKYVFTPELCNGHPVGTALMVDVNF